MTLLKVHPFTGRIHQMKVHLASAGMPPVGEQKYRCMNAQSPSWCNELFRHAISQTCWTCMLQLICRRARASMNLREFLRMLRICKLMNMLRISEHCLCSKSRAQSSHLPQSSKSSDKVLASRMLKSIHKTHWKLATRMTQRLAHRRAIVNYAWCAPPWLVGFAPLMVFLVMGTC